MIWQNCLYVEEHASDLAELCCAPVSVPVIWQNCLSVDSVPVIWQNCLCPCGRSLPVMLTELQVFGRCASDLAELYVCGGVCQ